MQPNPDIEAWHADADLATWFDQIEEAQEAARLPRRTDDMKTMLEGVAGGPLLARPSLAEQRRWPN